MTDDPSLCTVDAVARRIVRRTKVAGGRPLGTFTDATSPTADAVMEYIQDAAGEVYGALGPYLELAPEQIAPALDAMSALAAANIELAYWPEQTTTRQSQSPYQSLMDQYTRLLAVARNPGRDTDGDGTAESGGVLLPQATFPRDAGGLIGWGTAW